MCSAFVIIISVRYTHTHTDAVCIPIYNLKKTIASFGWGGSFSGNRACKARFYFHVSKERQAPKANVRIPAENQHTLRRQKRCVPIGLFFFLSEGWWICVKFQSIRHAEANAIKAKTFPPRVTEIFVNFLPWVCEQDVVCLAFSLPLFLA